jgi:opacity protein-like surface antigen
MGQSINRPPTEYDGSETAARRPDLDTAAGRRCGCDEAYLVPQAGGLLSRRPLRGLFRPLEDPQAVNHPLQQESWLYRPLSAGWFMGMLQGGPLIDDWVGMDRGFFGGYRLGWDESHDWGGEMRFAFGSIPLYDTQRAREANPLPIFNQRRDADLCLWDLDLLYYPWGDVPWRPYLMAGLGTARVAFTDRLFVRRDKTVFAMPLALGLKYRYSDRLALRFECADNIAFGGGSGFNTLHNVSLTAGLEVRFGGSRKAYWPWNPGRHYW